MVTVVTGASGFIGRVLVEALAAEGRSVRAVVHASPADFDAPNVEVVRADLRDPGDARRVVDGAEAVFHFASIISLSGDRDGAVEATNVGAAERLAEASLAGGIRRFVHCSTIHVFDLRGSGPVDEATARLEGVGSAYSRTKAEGERRVRAVFARGLSGVVVHPTAVVGPGDHRPSRTGQVLLDLVHRRLPALVAGGFDWVDVRDVCAGAIAAEQRGRDGDSYILSGHWHSARELAAIAEAHTGVRAPRITVPMWLARSTAPLADVVGRVARREFRFSSEAIEALDAAREIRHDKAARELGYAPRPLAATVADTYRWFESAGALA